MDPQCPLREKWIPVEVLQLFVVSLVEGMASMMESFTSDAGELKEVLRRADGALEEQSSRQRGQRSSAGGQHNIVTPLNLKKQLLFGTRA